MDSEDDDTWFSGSSGDEGTESTNVGRQGREEREGHTNSTSQANVTQAGAALPPALPSILPATACWPCYGGGGLPKEEVPTGDRGSWWDMKDGAFSLRGKSYLSDGIKRPSASAAFKIESVSGVECAPTTQLLDIGRRFAPLATFLSANKKSEYLIVNRMIPVAGATRNIIMVARRVLPKSRDAAFDNAWTQFKQGDAKYRDSHFKYCCNLLDAPWTFTKMIDLLGGQRPVIMGKGYIQQHHFTGANYVEIDVDIGSSVIARQIASACINQCSKFTIDECFVIEGQALEELPERVLCGIQYRNADTALSSKALQSVHMTT